MLYFKRFFILLLTATLLSSCAPKGADALAFLTRDASFELDFGGITAQAEKAGDALTLSFPKGSAIESIKILYRGGETSIISGESKIPLSKEAAEPLTSILSLFFSHGEPPKVTMSGEERLITYPFGTLKLDPSGVPIEATAKTALGKERAAAIINYTEKSVGQSSAES